MEIPLRLSGIKCNLRSEEQPLKAFDLALRCNEQQTGAAGIIDHDKGFCLKLCFGPVP